MRYHYLDNIRWVTVLLFVVAGMSSRYTPALYLLFRPIRVLRLLLY